VTGRYQTRFGHEMNAVGKTNLLPHVGLPHAEKTMGDHLQAAGYRTGIAGKWHLGAHAPFHPLKRGFHEFYGFLHEGHFFYPPPYRGAVTRLRVNEPPYDDANPVMRGTEPLVEPEYLTHAIAREAEAFIDRNAAGPFFLYVPFNAIHSPMQAPVDEVRKQQHIHDEQRRLFAAMLTAMDQAVGRILARLKKHGLADNTLVLFLSDNGGPTAELSSSNEPLRGGKGQLFEGGIRIPFAAQWPGRLPAGKVENNPVSSLDILPTALRAAGRTVPSDLDGIDLGSSRADRTLFWRYGPNLALRKGKWKIVKQRTDSFALFDLDADPGETRDLAAALPARLADLRNELDRLNNQMRAPLW